MNRHLFLFGGGPPFTEKLSEKFASLARGKQAHIGIIIEGKEGWETNQPVYSAALENQGVTSFSFFLLDQSNESDIREKISACTGLVIGGGNTEKYQEHIVGSELGEAIRTRYQEGIPVAGFSAGALISLEDCVISPKDNPSGSQLYRKGLGLLRDKVISVHFTTWEEEFSLKIALKKTNAAYGFGIDEETGIYFLNEEMEMKDGSGDIHLYKHK